MQSKVQFPFTNLVKGLALQKQLFTQIKEKIQLHKAQIHRFPQLDAILVGEDPSSHIYVKKKKQFCQKLDITFNLHHYPEYTEPQKISHLINQLNHDSKNDAILLQLPLPSHIDSKPLLSQIALSKDVDCLNPKNLGLSLITDSSVQPCTAQAVQYILETQKVLVEGRHAVVVGRSQMVGLPIAMNLQKMNATVTLIHKQSQNIEPLIRSADILVSATGQLRIPAAWVKPGAVVIDVGMQRIEGKLTGDLEDCRGIASTLTPVPGGVGPLTVAMLVRNVVNLWMHNHGIKDTV